MATVKPPAFSSGFLEPIPLRLMVWQSTTAMHHASALGHLDAVLQLIAHGAIADQAANDGRTVLDLAGNRNVHAVLAETLGR